MLTYRPTMGSGRGLSHSSLTKGIPGTGREGTDSRASELQTCGSATLAAAISHPQSLFCYREAPWGGEGLGEAFAGCYWTS